MELRVLKYFLMVAREENITKAAQILHITQPTLSRQLMQMEEELGVKLFIRSNHNIILTEDGMLLKRRAKELVTLAEKTKRDFLNRGNELTGEISIGCGELQSMNSLSKMIGSFQKKNPAVRFNFYSGSARNIRDNIEMGILDIGLLFEPIDIRKYEFVRMPQKETWGVLVKKDSELALKESVTPKDLINLPIILSRKVMTNTEFELWFGVPYEKLNIVASYDLLYNTAIMVQNDIGVAFTIKLESEYEGLKFIPLSPQIKGSSVLAWKKDQIYSPSTEAFLNHVKLCLENISTNTI